MRTISRFWSLLWRTFLVFLLLGVAIAILLRLLSVGIESLTPQSAQTAIQLKPTIWYAFLAITLSGLELILGINLVRLIVGKRLNYSRTAWKSYVLGLSFVLFLLATLNAGVAFLAGLDTWVAYKIYVAPLLFLCGVFILAARIPSPENGL
jgi:intracellular septation protein A